MPRRLSLLSLLAFFALAAPAAAYHDTDHNAAQLDPDFGTGGIVTTSFTDFGYDGNNAGAGDVVRQPDGKLVAVGDHSRPCCEQGSDVVLSRYNRDGSLDITFGDLARPGRQRTIVPATSYAIAEAVALQPDGKIVVAGWNRVGFGNPNLMVMRYHANGTLDTSFDAGGDGAGIVTLYSVGPAARAFDVLVDPDGKIVVAGWTQGTAEGGGLAEGFAVVRLNPNGAPDTTFNGNGIARVLRPSAHTDTGSAVMDGAQGVVRDPSGDLVVAGALPVASGAEFEPRLAAARFSPGGAPVAAWGTGEVPGVAFANSNDVPARGRALVRDPGGGFTVVGYLDLEAPGIDEPAITRFSSTGAIDTSFGFVSQQFSNSAGTAVSAQYEDVAVDASHGLTNRVIAFGTVGTDNFSNLGREFLFARYGGQFIDQGNFSPTGYTTVKIANGSSGAALVVQPDGKYVGFGTANGGDATGVAPGSHFALARLGAHAPQKVSDPSISGTPEVGQQLTLDPGQWEYDPTFEYQWMRCDAADGPCTNIDGATGSTYTVTAAEGGRWIRGHVRATNGSGSVGPVLSQSVGPVASVVVNKPENTAAPTISGTARQGQTLTATNGTWTNNPTQFAYQWERCSTPTATCSSFTAIGGAVSQTYTLGGNDVGYLIRVVVTAGNSGGTTPKDSAPVGPVEAPPAAAPANTAAPTISGTPKQGETLTATSGTWSNTPTAFAYQWQRCSTAGDGCTSFANIEGATAATYGLGTADVGRRIRVLVTASNAGGSATAESAPTALVAAATPVVQPKPPAPQPKPPAFTVVDTTRTARMPKVTGKPVDTALALIDKNIFSDVTVRYTHKFPGKREPDTGDVVVQKPAAHTPITSSVGDLQNVVLDVYAGPKPRGDDRCPETDLKADLKKLEQAFAEEVLRRAKCKVELNIVPSDNVSEPTVTGITKEGENKLEVVSKVPTDPKDNDLFLAFNDNPNGAGFNATNWTLKAPSGGSEIKNAFSVTVVDRAGRLISGAEVLTDISDVFPGDPGGKKELKQAFTGQWGRGKAAQIFNAYKEGKIAIQASVTVGDETLYGIGEIKVEKQPASYTTPNGDTINRLGARASASAGSNVFTNFVTWLKQMAGFGPAAKALDGAGTAQEKVQKAAARGTGAYPIQLAFGDPLGGGNAPGALKQIEVTFLMPDGSTATGTAWVIAAGGGNVIAAGGGNVIAAGGANVIAAGGGNVIAAGGGNVIAAGGGNLMFQELIAKGGKVIAAGGGNVIAAGGGNVIAAGGGNVIAQGALNVIAAGGGNVIAAGGGNVIAAGALNR